jgi:hypothetical protein
MRLPNEAGFQAWIVDEMTSTVRKARADGTRLSVTDEALRLAEHPRCSLSLDEIKDVILTVAVTERVPMELDSLQYAGTVREASAVAVSMAAL